MMLKYIGCALILISVLIISKEYKAYSSLRVERLSDYIDFLSHIERRIGGSLMPQHRLHEGFKSRLLEEDFFPKLREGGELYSAYTGTESKITENAHKILLSYFADFGKSSRDGELERTRETVKSLIPILEKEREASEKNIRLFETVSVAMGLGIIILLI